MARKARIVSSVGVSRADMLDITKRAIKDYLPRAGMRIERASRGRLGIYQPGWKKLSPDTLRRKANRLKKRGRRLPFERWGGADTPLIDKGKMARGIRHYERGFSTHITAPFPAEIHEQDPEMQSIANSTHTPPMRQFMNPALNEQIPHIVDELEEKVAQRLGR